MGFLTPDLSGMNLTVSTVMKQPTRITERIAALAADQIILDKLFHTLGQPVQGGALLFNVVDVAEFFTATAIEQRGPGDEYPVVLGVSPTPQLAKVQDWGGKFPVTDQAVTRNDTEYMSDQTTQLTNTIVERLNTRALESLDAALAATGGANIIPGHNWMNAVTFGPEANLSEGGELPAADLAGAQMAGEMLRLGVKYDTLLVNPQELFSLRVCYGDKLEAMLKSAGFTGGYFSYPLITPGTAYAVQRGQVGVFGVETPLTTETWRVPERRISWVQSFCNPVWAVNKPHMCMK